MKYEFKSQVCTTKEQSERLLALGLKKETADMVLLKEMFYDVKNHCTRDGEGYLIRPIDYLEGEEHRGHFPAWSLGRLIKDLMPQRIGHLELAVGGDYVGYYEDWCESESGMWWEYASETSDMFDNIISTIEWLIKEGYFNKEYLV